MPTEKQLANLRPWQKGQSGNPQGPAKPFTDALKRALECAEMEGGPTNAEKIVATCVTKAINGDKEALRILGMLLDRAEGPVKQQIEAAIDMKVVPWEEND